MALEVVQAVGGRKPEDSDLKVLDPTPDIYQ